MHHETGTEQFKLGKEHLYVLSLEEGHIHENQATQRIAMAAPGPEIRLSDACKGRIKDAFGPVIGKKPACCGSDIIHQAFFSDDTEMTTTATPEIITRGAEMVLCTGYMFTPASLGDILIMGLPGCVRYYNACIFVLVLPHILAGGKVTRRDFVARGHGG